MRVLVTGTEGYIGAVVPQLLMERGHEVIGVDAGFHRSGWLYGNSVPVWPKTLEKDIRLLDAADLDGIDAIVHMAELSNDPVGQLNPRITYDINHLGSLHLARLAKQHGIERFVYTSSCSVYGIAEDEMVDESSPTNPQTTYAICKTLVERDVSELADDGFSPTFLRNATAFGASPRLRFDIVINNLSGLAWTTNEIRMDSDGTPWRPFVHIRDIATAIACTLEAPRDVVHNEIFNVGNSRANYQVRDIAEVVARRVHRLHRDPQPWWWPRHEELSRVVRQDQRATAGILVQLGRRARRSRAQGDLRADRPECGRLRVARVHAPEADRVPAPLEADRRRLLLDRLTCVSRRPRSPASSSWSSSHTPTSADTSHGRSAPASSRSTGSCRTSCRRT